MTADSSGLDALEATVTVTVTGGGQVGHVGQTDEIGGGIVGIGVVWATSLGDGMTDPGMVLSAGEVGGASVGIDTVLDMTTWIGDEEITVGTVTGITEGVVCNPGVLEMTTTVGDDEMTIGTVTGTTNGPVSVPGVLEMTTLLGEGEMVVGIVTGTMTGVLDMTTNVGVEDIVVGTVTGTTAGVVCKEIVLGMMIGKVSVSAVSVLDTMT